MVGNRELGIPFCRYAMNRLEGGFVHENRNRVPFLRLRHVFGGSVGLAVGEGADAQHRALQRASATSVCSGGRDAYGA